MLYYGTVWSSLARIRAEKGQCGGLDALPFRVRIINTDNTSSTLHIETTKSIIYGKS